MKISFNILLIFIGYVWSLHHVITDKAYVTLINPKYITWGKMFAIRYGRRSPYYVNIEGENKHTWSNNVTVDIVFFEYLHNEYRRSFVELHFKLCDALNTQYMGIPLKKAGFVCPLQSGTYHLMNMSLDASHLPPVWPFQKAMISINITTNNTREIMATGIVHITLVETLRKSS